VTASLRHLRPADDPAGREEQSRLLAELAKLHAEAFPGFFLTTLGGAFLRLLYESFVHEDDGICIVAEENGRLVGLVAGTMAPSGFFRRILRKRGLRFGLATLPGLVRSPVFAARKCAGAIFYRGERPAESPDAALLSSLAVSPSCHGKGVGRQLVAAFNYEVARRGGSAVYLTTDNQGNDRTNRFYESCGFELLDTFQRPGNRTMNRWIKKVA
jgi:ribosomal protein S18 acetylase RimI-like enzyme